MTSKSGRGAAEFVVRDIRTLEYDGQFDLVTWIESSFFDEGMARRIHQALRPGGRFITDVRNPDHPRTRSRSGNWRTWREEGGIFHLERHETDPVTGRHEDAWVTVDPQRELIEERVSVTDRPFKCPDQAHLLRQVGFGQVELRTMEGAAFGGGEGPYWLWLVARR